MGIIKKVSYYLVARKALKFNIFRRNFFAFLHDVNSSFRLFREANSCLQIEKYYSHRHRLHRFEVRLYGAAFFKIFQVTSVDFLLDVFQIPDLFA